MITLAGKERSATTWLEKLILRNYRTDGIDSKFKHNNFGNRSVSTAIVISKHPLEWWFSYYKFAAAPGIEFGDFPINYFESWNDFHYSWIQAARNLDITFIRYDQLYEDPEDVLGAILDDRYENDFDRIDNRVHPTGIVSDTDIFRRAERVFAYDTYPELLEKLKGEIDLSILSYLGYMGIELQEK